MIWKCFSFRCNGAPKKKHKLPEHKSSQDVGIAVHVGRAEGWAIAIPDRRPQTHQLEEGHFGVGFPFFLKAKISYNDMSDDFKCSHEKEKNKQTSEAGKN